jgi:hypothetical protein
MTFRTLVVVHVLTAAIGTGAFWWLVMPSYPLEAIADGLTAAAVAGYAEIMIIRLGW